MELPIGGRRAACRRRVLGRAGGICYAGGMTRVTLSRLTAAVVLLAALSGCNGPQAPAQPRAASDRAQAAPVASATPTEAAMAIEIKSPVFNPGGQIPPKYTCDGDDTSPPLEWTGVPAQAKSLALISDDPDAPGGDWVHWVAYDIPVSAKGFPAGAGKSSDGSVGARQGKNSWGKPGYGGPCPPSGTHRYVFKLYALDAPTGLGPGATKEELLKAMEGHILGRGELIGRYQRSK
jgi:Raf kinase inhibitor-like YbhB/YbcL family protein